jgi:hypothetical protein
MITREVTPQGWKTFCERVRESCRGSLVSIEVQQPDGTTASVARDLPLRAIDLDEESDACNTNLVIEAGPERPVRHVVIEPIHIRLRHEGDGDHYNRVQIVAENGTTNAILHPGLSPLALQGVDLR